MHDKSIINLNTISMRGFCSFILLSLTNNNNNLQACKHFFSIKQFNSDDDIEQHRNKLLPKDEGS